MKQTINILVNNPRIEILRKKYDPNSKKIKTHITLVYPFEINDQDKLTEHIEYCLRDLAPFELVLDKFRRSSNYLVLDVGKNQEKLLNLYKRLNSGVLRGFENKDISIYLPHITMGIFDSNEKLMQALNELRARGSNFRMIVDNISLITLNKDGSTKEIRNFILK